MSKSRYSYPPDEFDTPAPHGAPVGVHRTQRSGWSKTWPFLVVAVVFAGLAFGGFKFFFDTDVTTPPADAASSATPADAGGTDGTSEDPGTDDPAQEPSVTEEPTPEEPNATAEPDFTVSVRVLNGAGIQGLAAAGAEVLTEAGFATVEADTYQNDPLPVSTVYYQAEELRATAEDIATRFGIPVDDEHLLLEPAIKAQVSVVLMEDFRL